MKTVTDQPLLFIESPFSDINYQLCNGMAEGVSTLPQVHESVCVWLRSGTPSNKKKHICTLPCPVLFDITLHFGDRTDFPSATML